MADFPMLPKVGPVRKFSDGMGDEKMDDPEPIRNPRLRHTAVYTLPDSELREITRLIGDTPSDVRTAKRIIGLRRNYPQATTPELYVMDYLRRKGVQFWFQQYLWGGRLVKGGLVADFTILYGKGGMVINVNGDYWHSKRTQRDRSARFSLTGATVNGIKIFQFIEIWESDLWRMKERIIELALSGIEVRGLRAS